MPPPWPESMEESEAKRPRVSQPAIKNLQCRRSIQSAGGLCWSSADLTLAASLLETPNARFPTVTFNNLEEKRRVFTLVYDVLRYKSILNQALSDVYFFIRYPHLKERCHLVWLLFFDLYKRDFTLRDLLEPEVQAVFAQKGLNEIDEILWQLRVKLAATISRLRIKSGAHSLSNLLPRHLRLSRSALEENIITGWVNIFKTSIQETFHYLERLGINQLSRDLDILEHLTFKTDHLLPRFLHIMPELREDLIESSLIRDHHLVMQERTFCLGPAVMAQLLKDYSLSGKVAQTHVNSPTTMAYFANLLINNNKIEALLVFGAGYRKETCEQYLRDLGIKNTHIYSESFAGLSAESRVLDNVIAVLATPPNTNSSVLDPVDLAVARGGDLQILQQLTDEDFASTPRGENINKFLCDQRDTLRRAMSKPQIQFVVYETHSRFTCENEEMATALVNELNNYAAEVHLEELHRAQGETQEREKERAQVEASDTQPEVPVIRVEDDLNLPIPMPVQSVVIPPSDLYEVVDLPDLCPNYEKCLDMVTEGTYIAVIKRKEITRLDPKYMIQMAEARGLFGRPEGTPKTKTTGQTARAKAALAALQARSDMMAEKNKTKVKVEMDRIAAPTRASLLRDVHSPPSKDCPRYAHHLAHDGTPSYARLFPKEPKTYLTPSEEEELIKRLYLFPRVNVYHPSLYEDLPPLEFWNSPASIIENYLQRKVFWQRLQQAYECNQNQRHNLWVTGDVHMLPNQLLKAMMQFSEEKNYFGFISSHQMETDVPQELDKDENKVFWDRVCPEVVGIPDIEITSQTASLEQNHHEKLFKDIKKRYFLYKDFYKLKNLKTEDKKPLALTIGKTQSLISESSLGSSSASDETNEQTSKIQQTRKSISEPISEQYKYPESPNKESLVVSARLPKIKYSFQSLKKPIDYEQNLNYHSDTKFKSVNTFPYLTRIPEENDSNLRGTLVTLKDSIELAQGRLSKFSQMRLPKKTEDKNIRISISGHKDPYTMSVRKQLYKPDTHYLFAPLSSLSQSSIESKGYKTESSKIPPLVDDNHSTLTSLRDSIELAIERLSFKPKGEAMICDICNNQYKPIRFICSEHADEFVQSTPSHSTLSKSTSFLNHKDSVEIIQNKLSYKQNQPSVATQTEGVENINQPSATKKPDTSQLDYLMKGSQKRKNVCEEESNSENVSMPPSILSDYLMSSINIKQVVLKDIYKPLQ